jgi:hypothetical protein
MTRSRFGHKLPRRVGRVVRGNPCGAHRWRRCRVGVRLRRSHLDPPERSQPRGAANFELCPSSVCGGRNFGSLLMALFARRDGSTRYLEINRVTYGRAQHDTWRRRQADLDDRLIPIQMPGLWLYGFQPTYRNLRAMQGAATGKLDVHRQGARATGARVRADRQDPCRHGSGGRASGRGAATPPGWRWVNGPL